MFQFLAQPYPREQRSPWRWLLTSAGSGLFVALFLLIFQPFGLAQWNDPVKPYLIAGYGLVTFICLTGVGLVFPKVLGNFFDEKNWTVGREIAWTLFVIIFIALGNILYSQWTMGNGFAHVLVWLSFTAAVGVIPATVITLLSYTRLLRRYATDNLQIEKHEPESVISRESGNITLTAENEKDSLTVAVDDLLFIESADNYSEVVFIQKDKVEKTLLRGSLSRFEEQIHHPDLVRCHRSYIVNLQQVESISGNAQGYKLQLKHHSVLIPVARRYGDRVADYFRK
ncbi:LytR/AlgR family response regulator transcription factor [Salmonirosea aquatica]|uniref:LytTR family transcriptional regulator n=1 Tax=Salmonirosea aquatica TaxID=2654236 RepID=A0A7C9BGP7_9BACT|nr:LytTR family transcriptional regulator [Cytophagaceae bacterium SJW1-29]